MELHWRSKRVIFERFMGGESISALARDYIPNPHAGTHREIESAIREEVRRRQLARKKIVMKPLKGRGDG